MNLSGKVAVITGGARNYGKSIAIGLLEAGAKTAVNDLDNQALDKTIKLLKDKAGADRVHGIPGDISTEEGSDEVVKETIERFGRIDILVNNAALRGGWSFLDYPVQEMDRMIAVNLRGALLCSQKAAREMARGPGGSIIHVGSVNSIRGRANSVVYAACKGALDASARSMAVDLARFRIRVNVLAPTYPIDHDEIPDTERYEVQLGENGIMLRDLANAVVFFSSDRAEHITGQILCVDNGLTATLRWPPKGLVSKLPGGPQ